jgi:hypothetical protein
MIHVVIAGIGDGQAQWAGCISVIRAKRNCERFQIGGSVLSTAMKTNVPKECVYFV